MAIYYGPDRYNQSWDYHVATRDEMVYWDPFSTDDGWPGYDDMTSKVSPLLPLRDVVRAIDNLMATEQTTRIR